MRPLSTLLTLPLTLAVATAQATWTELFPSPVPTGRSGIVGCSDGAGMLVFGGRNAAYLNQLYRFDALAGTWTDLAPTGTLPSARNNYAAAYDTTRGVLVVYGGVTGSGNANINGETWEWNPTTNTWANRTPAAPVYGTNTPPQFTVSRMVYDSLRGHCLLFGGQGNTTTAPIETNQTWTWDGATWTRLLPTNSPPARRSHVMAYNPQNGTTLVWGGVATTGSTVYHADTWLWNGTNWTVVPTATVPHANATYAASQLNGLVYDELRQRFVLTSGVYTGTLPTSSDTYEFDGSDWINRGPSGLPNGRYASAVAYVQATAKTYEFGGYSFPLGGIYLNRTFEYQTGQVATVSNYGAGCTGPGGALQLAADNLPWTGSTFSATATGIGPQSLALGVVGVATASLSLPLLVPQGGAGCTLLNTADAIVTLLPVAGAAQLALPIGPATSLAGATLHFQVAEMQFGASLQWIGLFSTNGVSISVGVR